MSKSKIIITSIVIAFIIFIVSTILKLPVIVPLISNGVLLILMIAAIVGIKKKKRKKVVPIILPSLKDITFTDPETGEEIIKLTAEEIKKLLSDQSYFKEWKRLRDELREQEDDSTN